MKYLRKISTVRAEIFQTIFQTKEEILLKLHRHTFSAAGNSPSTRHPPREARNTRTSDRLTPFRRFRSPSEPLFLKPPSILTLQIPFPSQSFFQFAHFQTVYADTGCSAIMPHIQPTRKHVSPDSTKVGCWKRVNYTQHLWT